MESCDITETKPIVKTEIFDHDDQSGTEDSSYVDINNCKAECDSIVRTEYLKTEEIKIKRENTLDIDTEAGTSNTSFQVDSEEASMCQDSGLPSSSTNVNLNTTNKAFVNEKTRHKVKKSKAKPKVTNTWPREDIRLLITTVELHPSIWDFACADHKNLMKRDAAWNIIDSALNNRYGVPECKAKWTNVKTAYQKAKAKMLADPSFQTQWPYWTEMQFMTKGESANNSISVPDFRFDVSPNNDETESSSNTEFQLVPKITTTSHLAVNNGIAKRNRKRSNNPSKAPSSASEAMPRATKEMEKNAEDEWQTIGNYLAQQLRNIAEKHREKAERVHRKLVKTVLETLDELDDQAL